MSSTPDPGLSSGEQAALVVASLVIIAIKIVIVVVVCHKRAKSQSESAAPDSLFLTLTMDKFLKDMARENPIRFTSQQLRIATDNFTNLLGSGGFGTVYKGLFSNGTIVAVKVLYGYSDKKIEEQFMAEVSTIGRVHHFNLVRLYGFCFERNLRALVYEYMSNGSLDKFLYRENKNKTIGLQRLHEIAVGTARGIAYLHEECQQRIIHYDIKPGNILLDAHFYPKVADFGLAKLSNRENTHVTMTGGRGTPGYAAPELWMPFPITHKCDVYSFGMLLFEIAGRRRNLDDSLPESQEWFPKWVWKKFEYGELGDLMIVCEIEEKDRETAERMFKVALLCVQHKPQLRPVMSIVVKMLEGAVEIPAPSNPFPHMMFAIPCPVLPGHVTQTSSFNDSDSSQLPYFSYMRGTPIMRKHEIEIAST
ncbi:Mitogen-activated protein kinase kinase kinase [Parasponia andersonii]|uniref:Mitogen-activated protein kinase kinase kinase n=1 Tax=Parasponia andersonii TaxID=3476 RepID=A0A2P5DRH5_PARAD|nr:Mitogen-activated protein kinase kinase kinase [Parasponia andersonii]